MGQYVAYISYVSSCVTTVNDALTDGSLLCCLHDLRVFIVCTSSGSRVDIKRLYYQAGVENKPTVFLFTDTQVLEESFLEDINNILSSGEVPNLYKPDEFEEVRTKLSLFLCYIYLGGFANNAFFQPS